MRDSACDCCFAYLEIHTVVCVFSEDDDASRSTSTFTVGYICSQQPERPKRTSSYDASVSRPRRTRVLRTLVWESTIDFLS